MGFFEWLKKFKLINYFLTWLFPVDKYESELNNLLQPYEEIKSLYELLISGRSAARLHSIVLQMASASQATVDSAKANLLLGYLYAETIEANNFALKKDTEKSEQYKRKAQAYLGSSAVLSEKSQKILDCIRQGGESPYAFKKLRDYSDSNQPFLSSLAKKVLSFIYQRGCNHNDLSILPNQELAEKYQGEALQGLRAFQHKLTTLAKRLATVWFKKDKANGLLSKIAEHGNHCANFLFGQRLAKKGETLQKIIPYFEAAASKTKDSALSISQNGLQAARIELSTIYGNNNSKFKDEHKANHYLFQIAIHADDQMSRKLANDLSLKAEQGNRTAILQAGLCYLNNKNYDVIIAENMFDKASKAESLGYSSYEQSLYEKFCAKLADHYESLFLNEPESLTFELNKDSQSYLSKAIFYLQRIPKSSAKYQEIQFRIAHYQQYFLKNEMQAGRIYQKLSETGDTSSAYLAVLLQFKQFMLQQKKCNTPDEVAIIARYEQNHKPFIEQVMGVSGSFPLNGNNDTKSPQDLLQRLMNEFVEIRMQSDQEQQLINSVVALIKSNSNSTLASMLYQFAARFNSGAQKQYINLSEPNKTLLNSMCFFALKTNYTLGLIPDRPLLQVILNILDLLKSLKKTNNEIYFAIIEKKFLLFAAAVCSQCLSHGKIDASEKFAVNKTEDIYERVDRILS